MSSSRKTNKEIIQLLDNLENKLNRHRPQYQGENENNNYNNRNELYGEKVNIANNINNYMEYPFINNQNNIDKISPSMEFDIRKIIKDEFNSLILPYQQEMHNQFNIFDSKIDKHSNEINDLKSKKFNSLQNFMLSGDNDFNLNQQNALDNNKYVLKFEYENKIKELTHQITNLNNFSRSLKEAFDNLGDNKYIRKDDFGQKMNEIQSQFDTIFGEINQFHNNENNMNQSLGELKINNNKIKNELLKEIQSLKNDVVGNVNVIKGINQNNAKDYDEDIESVRKNINELKNEFDILTKQLDMNFMNSLKTIVNQHVTIAEFNIVKNQVLDYKNQIIEIRNKNNNHENNINNIQNKINSLENNINNFEHKNESEIIELKSNSNKNSLEENQLKLLNSLKELNINQLKSFDFNCINEFKDNINQINSDIEQIKSNKNDNNEDIESIKKRIEEINNELKTLKGKIDLDKSMSSIRNNIFDIENRMKRLENRNIALVSSELQVEQVNNLNDNKENNNVNNNINLNDKNKIINNNINLNNNNKIIAQSNFHFFDSKNSQNDTENLQNGETNSRFKKNLNGSQNYGLNDDEFEEDEGGFIILDIEGNKIGIIIDRINRVISVNRGEIKPPPQMLSGIGTEYIHGVVRQEQSYLIILDTRRLFNANELQKIVPGV